MATLSVPLATSGNAQRGVRHGGRQVGWHRAWLAHPWTSTSLLLRAALTVLIGTLAVINAVGVYGRLTAAHLTVDAGRPPRSRPRRSAPASKSGPMLSATLTGVLR